MITLDQSHFLQQLQQVAQLVDKSKENHLLSYISQISTQDMLMIFENGKVMGSHHRSYWTDGESLTLVGIGSAIEFTSQGKNRFQEMKEIWSEQRDRVVKNMEKRATGPLMLGGFAFNDSKRETSEWRHFPEAAFVMPKFLVTEVDDETWLTINIEVFPNMDVEETYLHLTREVQRLLTTDFDPVRALPNIKNMDPVAKSEWLESVSQVTQQIKAGDVEKVVLSRVLNVKLDETLHSEVLLEKLLDRRTYGFVFAFERDGHSFVGATPERLVKKDGHLVYCDCLAGTEARGQTKDEDNKIGVALLHDEKNLAEHHFVVEMIKNAMARFARDVMAPSTPQLVKAESVQHLYTPVSGWLNENTTLFDAIEQLHPTPAMGGTPRDKALTIINELEPHDRGWYAAPIGWVDEEGNGDFAVGIRSCLIIDNTAKLFAGCGIVKDSIPEKEFRETNLKFRPILNALEATNND